MKLDDDHKSDAPLFKTWTAWYVIVIFVLVLLIIGFFVLTKTFA